MHNGAKPLLCDDFPGRVFTAAEARELCGLKPGTPLTPYIRKGMRVGGRYVFRYQKNPLAEPEKGARRFMMGATSTHPAKPTSPLLSTRNAAYFTPFYDLGGARTRGEAYGECLPINPMRQTASDGPTTEVA